MALNGRRPCIGSGMAPKTLELELLGKKLTVGVCRACGHHPERYGFRNGIGPVVPPHKSPEPDAADALRKVGEGIEQAKAIRVPPGSVNELLEGMARRGKLPQAMVH